MESTPVYYIIIFFMEIYTASISDQENIEADDRKIKFIDTTVKSGIKAFAPAWEMVLNYKNGRITEQDYRDRFIKMMRNSILHRPKIWDDLLNNDIVAIGCYCAKGAFCHRLILMEYITIYAASRNIQVTYLGEWVNT